MARRFRPWPGVTTCVLVVVLAGFALRAWRAAARSSADSAPVSSTSGSRIVLQPGPCQIIRAEDGRTLLIAQDQHQFRVRLQGVALPAGKNEPLAQNVLERIAPAGPASIELDKRRAAADGAWLAYVYVREALVNANLIATGWARYDVYPGDSLAIGRQLKQAQDDARRNRLGVWKTAD
jgi:endonuclease YncB( thermonuclease family)